MKRLLILLVALIAVNAAFSQTPQQFKYQAVLRNADGTIIANTAKTVIIDILQGSVSGTSVFTETQNVTTTAQGIINLNIGSVNTTGIAGINWATNTYFIKITVGGIEMGTSQLLSVPYAINAKNTENYSGTITTSQISDLPNYLTNYIETDPIFGAWNKSTGISITKSQISDLPNYLESYTETDPIFGAWNKSTGISITKSQISDLPNYLESYTETDPIFGAWNKSTGISITKSQISDLPNYLESYTETDPIFGAWNKSTGISITKSQISDFPVNATTTVDGFMSNVDKTKLDGLTQLTAGAGISINGTNQIVNSAPDQTVAVSGANGITVTGTYPNFTVANTNKQSTFRWNVFNTYSEGAGAWPFGNTASLFGGITPSIWTDGTGRAGSISSDKDVQRTLFNQKCFPGKNAMVYSETYLQYSSTSGKVAVALFRIKNTTASAIIWPISFYYTCNSAWSESAGLALNGVELWQSSVATGEYNTTVNITIPANRTSTVIVSSPSGPNYNISTTSIYVRSCRLAFFNNCLQLPAGLEFTDDLDNATGDWTQ